MMFDKNMTGQAGSSLKRTMTSKPMMSAVSTSVRSFAAAASLPATPSSPSTHAIPTGSWTVYFHEPEDTLWTAASYKLLQKVNSWEALGALLRELGPHKTTNGLLRIMRGDISPLWENKANIRGGSYCLKVPRRSAIEVFTRDIAAAALGSAAKDATNEIVGVTISPKKGFCIIKIWNLNAKAFGKPSDLELLHEDVKEAEIIYRCHTDQRM
jgi:hypothetical protein